MARRKKKSMFATATFKALIIVLLAILFVWIATKINKPWYDNDENPKTTQAVVSTTLGGDETTVLESTTKSEQKTTLETTSSTESETTTTTTTTTTTANSTGFKDLDEYENRTVSWSFKRNTDHSPVEGYNEGVDIGAFSAYYIGNTNEKVVYLTFDEGYENGFSTKILDILSANSVRATFFPTKKYIENNVSMVKRMKSEGHYVGNHSATHPDMTSKTPEEFVDEIESTREAMEELTGYDMDMFFRPPEGKFSERTLYMTKEMGYKTIFWSMAYRDWEVNNQPGKEAAYQHVVDNVHPGAIILLHAVSESNTEALDDIIKELKAMGYRFGTLNEL